MKKLFVVFWLETKREIYGDGSYYVLGEWMKPCDTKEEAIEYIKSLNLKSHQGCTIMEVWTGKY